MQAFYFLVITITTVGYGDIHPIEWLSRSVMVCIILLALGILPGQVAQRHLSLLECRPTRLTERQTT